MSKKLTVTIGIPAYNEELSIGALLHDILKQECDFFEITRIIVSSDASTDGTGEIVRSFADSRIEYVDNKIREGVAARQNQIIELATTDVLLLINADVSLPNKDHVRKLLWPIYHNSADLVSGNLIAVESTTFLARILEVSLLCKTALYEKLKGGDNLYTCHGTTRAFSRRLYTAMRFKQSVAEDAFSYLYAKKNNYSYAYVSDAITVHKLPETLIDHKKQSFRFFQSKAFLNSEFGAKFVQKEYAIPLHLILTTGIRYFLRYPLEMSAYAVIGLTMAVWSHFSELESNTWSMAKSSKLSRSI